MQKDDYNKYVRHNVTKTYKHPTANTVKNINYKSQLLAEKMIELKKQRKRKFISLSKIIKKVFPQIVIPFNKPI